MATLIKPVCGARAPSLILCSEDVAKKLLPKKGEDTNRRYK